MRDRAVCHLFKRKKDRLATRRSFFKLKGFESDNLKIMLLFYSKYRIKDINFLNILLIY